MPKYLCLFIILLYNAGKCRAQYDCKLIDSAKYAYTHGDTVKAMDYLKQYATSFPQNVGAMYAYRAVGRWYAQKHQPQTAISTFVHILEIKPRYGFVCGQQFAVFDSIEKYSHTVQADICVYISNMYKKMDDKANALKYLDLADSTYLPYQGCANGMISYKTKLSLSFADYYLKYGDTAKAMNRLLDFYMSGEGHDYKVAEKLKEVLRYKYTRQQIADEIENGISTLTLAPERSYSSDRKAYWFIIFGHKQIVYGADLKACITHLRHEPNLNLLKS